MADNPEWELLNTTAGVFNSNFGEDISAIATYDLLTDNGVYINLQGMQVRVLYEL